MTCGHEKRYDAICAPLVCNLPAGHGGRHGVRRSETEPPYVTWEAAP